MNKQACFPPAIRLASCFFSLPGLPTADHNRRLNAICMPEIDFQVLTSPILLQGNHCTAYRDPAACYHDGVFYLYFTLVETELDGRVFLYLAMTTSADLQHFSPVQKLTVRDQAKNFSSPGNVVLFEDSYYLCCQTYCREHGEKYGNERSRIWLMRSKDLLHWDEPQLLRVKGNAIPEADMGRMIDPYLICNREGVWHCFFKQNGVSVSQSTDLQHWQYCGRTDCGENVCVLEDGGHYRLWHSPRNGIAEKVSTDLLHWQDAGKLITLGQKNWPWAQGRLTAGMVLDLRQEPQIGKALLFFHGTGPEDEETIFDQYASIGVAWSDDLEHWQYPM